MAGEIGPAPYGEEITLPHPKASTLVPQLETHQPTQAEQDQFAQVARELNLIPEGDIDETAVADILQAIRREIEQDPSCQDDVMRAFQSFKSGRSSSDAESLETSSGAEGLGTLGEAFQWLAQQNKKDRIVLLQGILYEAKKENLCKLVKQKVKASGLTVIHISFDDPQSCVERLPETVGAIQVYIDSPFQDISLNVNKLLTKLAEFLEIEIKFVLCHDICCGSGFWVTILAPQKSVEFLRKEIHRSDMKEYLASLGITKIKFLKPQKADKGVEGGDQREKRSPETTETGAEPTSEKQTEKGKAGPEGKSAASPRHFHEGKPGWMSWTSDDILQHFSKSGHSGIGEKLKAKTGSGKEMVKWNPEFLMKIGLEEKDLDIVKEEMMKIGVFQASLATKVMNDPVHKHMEFHPLCVKIIDTPEFQRLRNIKQLGTVYMVYPGAAHNRFEHSLGVGFLAQTLAQSLQQRQPELGITEEDVLCVTIAGLCHDLGHGPHSYLFEQFMKAAGKKWEHEDASVMMFNHLMTRNNLKTAFRWYGIGDKKYLDFIRVQIKGKKITEEDTDSVQKEKRFLLEIVANRRNGIDVDKWDFIARDCLMLGIPNSFDHLRFMKHARVIITLLGQFEICSRDKEAEDLYKMFQTIHFLNRRAYQHKTQQAMEAMLVDVLLCADKSGAIKFRGQKKGEMLRISECVDDPVAFTSLDDSIFNLIQLSTSDDEDIREAKDLLDRLQNRKFYRLVGETDPTDVPCKPELLRALTKDLSKVAVKEMRIDYGSLKNPILETHFYAKTDPFTALTIQREQVSLALPVHFSEYIVRLYCKSADDDSITEARKRFLKWLPTAGLRAREAHR